MFTCLMPVAAATLTESEILAKSCAVIDGYNNRILFDEKVRYSEDVQFIWRCLFYNKKTVFHLEKANYNYILHANSTMTASGVEKILTGSSGSLSFEDSVS